MSNVSNRVMNMKFMQKSTAAAENVKEELQKQTIKDQSEWVLPESTAILRKKLTNIQTVGYASINSFASFDDDSVAVPARRVYETESAKSKPQEASKEDSKTNSDESHVSAPQPDDLEALWKNNKPGKNSTKRKNDTTNSKAKKHKAK